MQSVSSKIWTRVAVSISYGDNHYTLIYPSLNVVCYLAICCYIYFNQLRVFANEPGDLSSIPGRVTPKTLKMVLDNALLNTQQYKVRIKGKVGKSREKSSVLPLHLGVVAIEKGAFWSPSTTVTNLLTIYLVTSNLNEVYFVFFGQRLLGNVRLFLFFHSQLWVNCRGWLNSPVCRQANRSRRKKISEFKTRRFWVSNCIHKN